MNAPRTKQGGTALFDTLRTASKMTDRILVGVSGGKDSAVVLDLCKRFFPHVTGFFLYLVKGLGFQERILQYYERRYQVEIIRAPHFMLSEWMRYGGLRQDDPNVRITSTRETYDYLRELSGTYWIACGERISDSIIRRAMIRASGTIDDNRGRIYPIAYWNKKNVMEYIKRQKLKLGEDSSLFGFSFRSFMPFELKKIHEHFPDDYRKIEKWFPLVDASRMQGEFFGGENDE